MITKGKHYDIIKNDSSYKIQINKFPTSLYQYRSINEFSVDALLKNGIWATSPVAFNDPYDSSFTYDEKYLKKKFKTMLEKMDFKALRIEDTSQSNIDSLVNEVFSETIRSLNNTYRKCFAISCFSECIDSEIMWAHYANSAKGFAVEYEGEYLKNYGIEDKQKIEDSISQIAELFFEVTESFDFITFAPVIYTNKKYNMNDFIAKYVNTILPKLLTHSLDKIEDVCALGQSMQQLFPSIKDESLTAFYTIMFLKSSLWKYEKEWRLVVYNPKILNRGNDHVFLPDVFPKAIYLGEKISQYDKIALVEIAENHLHVPIYQMQTKVCKSKNKLVPVKL